MPSRYKSRQRALQILFLTDIRKQAPEQAITAFYDSLYSEESEEPLSMDGFMEELVTGTSSHLSQIDDTITKHSQNWRLERMSAVDRNILRMAVFEMAEVNTPAAVVIDQALELARRFSGDESVPFINGVLDAIRRSRESPPEMPAEEKRPN